MYPSSYVKLLMGMDLTKHFYFSYTYDLAHTVQHNFMAAAARKGAPGPGPGQQQQQVRCSAFT